MTASKGIAEFRAQQTAYNRALRLRCKRIQQLSAKGWTLDAIAKAFKISPQRVHQILQATKRLGV